ncbi:MAG: hypothetical protein AABN34_17270 [Acidobacteriota bacterium]
MIVLRAPLRIPVVFLAVASVTAAMSLLSSASQDSDEQFFDRIAERLQLDKQPTGTLIVLGGNVTVNQTPARTGLTIISGSTMTTSANGRARIELGSLGRIEVGYGTTIYLTLLPVMVFLKSNCPQTHIKVTRGQVEVLSPKKESIPAGKAQVYKGSVEAPFEAMTNGDTDFVIGCDSRNIGLIPNTGAHGLGGLLALLGNSLEAAPVAPVFSALTP